MRSESQRWLPLLLLHPQERAAPDDIKLHLLVGAKFDLQMQARARDPPFQRALQRHLADVPHPRVLSSATLRDSLSPKSARGRRVVVASRKQ